VRPFRYCADPVCLAATAAYLLNRLWIAPHWGSSAPFLTAHFADLLLVPSALPLLLWLQRRTGLRLHDQPPQTGEILVATGWWALLFEGVFPPLLHRGVGDPLDVLAYAAGALLAALCWRHSPTLAPPAGKLRLPAPGAVQ